METINVKSTDETKVGIWEVNADHPNGEIYVSGNEVVEVAKTSRVNKALARGLIIEVVDETKVVKKRGRPPAKTETET